MRTAHNFELLIKLEVSRTYMLVSGVYMLHVPGHRFVKLLLLE